MVYRYTLQYETVPVRIGMGCDVVSISFDFRRSKMSLGGIFFRRLSSKSTHGFLKDNLRIGARFTSNSVVFNGKNRAVAEKLAVWVRIYEDFVGLSEVKEAQGRVIAAERKFLETQELRRERQMQTQQMQLKLKEIHLELDKTSRGEDRYLSLITQEHAIIKEEKKCMDDFQFYEKAEREHFALLSSTVRESHEKERAYAEKTKYWSVIGSICGAIIGILGTTVNSWMRMKELRGIVTESSASVPKVEEMVAKVQAQQGQMTVFVGEVKNLLGGDHHVKKDGDRLPSAGGEIMAMIRKQDENLANDMRDIKAMISSQRLIAGAEDTKEGNAGVVVYMGRDVERMVKDAQNNLEWKIKINSLATVAMIYGAFAVAVPVLYALIGGGGSS